MLGWPKIKNLLLIVAGLHHQPYVPTGASTNKTRRKTFSGVGLIVSAYL